MRLSKQQLDTIAANIKIQVPVNNIVEARIFGSRLNDTARGGDVDIYIELKGIDVVDRVKIQSQLKNMLEGVLNLPVDIIIQDANSEMMLVSNLAKKEGMILNLA